MSSERINLLSRIYKRYNSPFEAGCILFFIICFSLLSCSRSFNPDIERGSSYIYKRGFPEASISVVGFLDDENRPGINLAIDVVMGSLIFKEEENRQTARVAFDIRVLRKENSTILKSERFTRELKSSSRDVVYNQNVYQFEQQIPAQPGEFEVDITITDLISSKQVTHSTQVIIPNPESGEIDLTNIRMMGKDSEESNSWFPLTRYDVDGSIDSLKFLFQVVNSPSDEPLTITSRLLRYKSDTTAARLIHEPGYSASNIEYEGIDYDKDKVLQTNQRKLLQSGKVLIEFKFISLARGNYRFEVTTSKENGKKIYKARDFGIKSANYPTLKTPAELARPLIYLMNDKEYEKLIAIEDPDSLKQEVDRFWLKHVGNKDRAKNVIKMFYERVEEANKQFSGFKEGWKTDPGMIYILFGPPWYVEKRVDYMMWSYSYNRYDPGYNYVFRMPKLKTEYYPFTNYLLQRHHAYFDVYYRQKQLWLTGNILTMGI